MTPFEKLKNTVAKLRSPEGCAWDREQTHQSLIPFLMEECAELIEAIESEDWDHVQEELGDLLLQVLLHSQMAEEENRFSLESVANMLNEKLIRRHPHVFGDGPQLNSAQDVLDQWQVIKSQEKKSNNQHVSTYPPFKNLPPELAALLKAYKICRCIRKQDLPLEDVANKNKTALLMQDVTEDAVGQLLFEIVALCEQKNIDPEGALRRYCTHVKSTLSKHDTRQ